MKSSRRGSAPILSLSGFRLQRGTTTILDAVNWRVNSGEHWVILGANGSGKTSLLKALTGYLSPTAGQFEVLGQVYGESDWRELRFKIGVVTSAFATAIPPSEIALDTVVSGKFGQLDLWAYPSNQDRAAARRLLRLVGASRLERREWIYLSQGERQRVLIARALMAKPRLLILDEPCAGLDPVAREKFVRFVDGLARRGRHATSLVLVTHHVEEITPAFTHALLLRAGQVVGAGPCARVLTSASLSHAFGAPITLRRRRGRYALEIIP